MSKKKRPPSKPISNPYLIDNYTPVLTPKPVPGIEHYDDSPLICITFSAALLPYLLGLLETYRWRDKWGGSDADKERGTNIAQELMDALIGGNCMPDFDPCCPETNDLLTQIKVLNQLIVNNQITIINNGDTVINQNDTQIVNNYIAAYNQYVYNSNQVRIFNELMYDGTPQSIHPDVPTDGWGGDEATRNALCVACQRYLNDVLWNLNFALAICTGLSVAAAAALIAAGLVLSPVTFGASAGLAALAAGLLIAAGSGVMSSILHNPEAQRKVLCCMFDTLKDADITPESFKAIGTGCTFEDEPNGAALMDMVHQASQVDANYLAFLRMVGESQGQGNALACECGCEDDIVLEDFAGTGCVITPMGNCLYRFTQSTPTIIGSATVYYFSFRDIMSQCLLVENSPDPTKPSQGVGLDTTSTTCAGVTTSQYVGGFSGSDSNLRSAHWSQADSVTYYKITKVV